MKLWGLLSSYPRTSCYVGVVGLVQVIAVAMHLRLW